jgi:hypothetical protein
VKPIAGKKSISISRGDLASRQLRNGAPTASVRQYPLPAPAALLTFGHECAKFSPACANPGGGFDGSDFCRRRLQIFSED